MVHILNKKISFDVEGKPVDTKFTVEYYRNEKSYPYNNAEVEFICNKIKIKEIQFTYANFLNTNDLRNIAKAIDEIFNEEKEKL